MLLNYDQFLLKQAVRSPMHLSNPKVVASEDIQLPRHSVIHYLDYHSEQAFPTRDLNYLNGTPPVKRIPVHHVLALNHTLDATVVENRTLDKQVRAWQKSHNRDFRAMDLLLVPNTDIQTHALINYQNLKGLYRYKGSALAEHSRYTNVHQTYWETVHKAITVDPAAQHFVHLQLPSLIPSKGLLDNLLKMPLTTYARVVHNPDLNGVIQLYLYLNDATRDRSTMKALTEADCAQVTVELSYQGYSCFFNLAHLVALAENSALESKRKLNADQLGRLYLMLVLKIQKKVFELQSGDVVPEAVNTAEDTHDDLEIDEDSSDTPPPQVQMHQGAPVGAPTLNQALSSGKPSEPSQPDLDQALSGLTEGGDLDVEFLEGQSDDLFAKLMSQADTPVSETDAKDTSVDEPEDAAADTPATALTLDYSVEQQKKLLTDPSLEENLTEYLTTAKASGSVNAAEIRSLKKLFEERKAMKSPYGGGLIDEQKVVKPEDITFTAEDTKLDIKNDLVDDELKSETLFNFDRLYLERLLKKDVLGCVTHLEKAGIVIKDYQVEENHSALGSYEMHKLTLKPYKGKESTVYFRLPIINEEGEFRASGVDYRCRKQRQDLPLRKISPTRATITSNYGKLFIERVERKTYDSFAAIASHVKADYLGEQQIIETIRPGSCYDNTATRPNMVMAMSREFKQFATKTHTFLFDPTDIEAVVKPEVLASLKKAGTHHVLGYRNQGKGLLVMDMQDRIYHLEDLQTPIGSLPKLLGMDLSKLPIQFATVKILGDTLALGPVLAYYLGLKGLIEVTQTQVEVLAARKQVTPTEDQLVIRLLDAKLLVNVETPIKKLLFGGFAFYKDTLKTLTLESMNDKGVYLEIFEQRGSQLVHLKELDLLRQLFLDPMTQDVLRSMNEPDEYIALLIRAGALLEDFKHPDINDPMHSRIRGYDRVPGLMYKVLTQSVRTNRLGMSKGKIELDPYGVWNAITQDTTVKIIEDSNPITDTKEVEALTFTGADGLSKGATPEKMRRYHKNDIGLVSEATVDSSDVALNSYLSPYAKLSNLRGRVSDREQTRSDTIFSTSVHLTPMGEQDDQLACC